MRSAQQIHGTLGQTLVAPPALEACVPVASDVPAPQVFLPDPSGAPARDAAAERSARAAAPQMFSVSEVDKWAQLRRRERKLRMLGRAALCAVLAASFVAGFFWKAITAERAAEPSAVAEARSDRLDDALRLMDEAARAKTESRSKDAVAAAAAARHADPAVRGVDIFVGTVAIEAAQPETARLAAEQALRRQESEAAAKLLLALHQWMVRGEGSGVREAVGRVEPLLTEASEAEPSNMEVMFFWGDIASFGGREDLAHRRLLGGVHRQQPWLSSATIAAKMELAAEEAASMKLAGAQNPSPPPPPTPVGEALVGLSRAALSGSDPAPALAALRAASTEWQAKQLLCDYAFDRPDTPPEITAARDAPIPELPGGSIDAPGAVP